MPPIVLVGYALLGYIVLVFAILITIVAPEAWRMANSKDDDDWEVSEQEEQRLMERVYDTLRANPVLVIVLLPFVWVLEVMRRK